MWSVIITLFAAALVSLLLFLLVSASVRKRQHLPHEKLDQNYIYRKEPHADQVTEKPNKLKDNEVTKD